MEPYYFGGTYSSKAVEAATAKVEAPLNGRVCGWGCLGSYDPALVPEEWAPSQRPHTTGQKKEM